MKKQILSTFIIISAIFYTNLSSAQTYCVSKSNAPWSEWIANVNINTLTNASEKTRPERYAVGYSDWTDKGTSLVKGQAYPLSITPGLSYSTYQTNLFFRAWIDFNANGIFEDSEKILEQNNANQSVTQSVNVPTTAVTGTARLRVSMKKDAYPTACETFVAGEVEDYVVSIQAANGGGGVPPPPVTNSCRSQDSIQLVSLYNATNGINWAVKWNLSRPINTWNGVSLNANGCVQSVFMINNNLVGTLPNLTFSNLEELHLDANQLYGTIPNMNLPNLKTLSLSTNMLTGNIPNSNFPKLEYLDLSENQLYGTIPNFNLPNLKTLNLYDNYLNGSIPNFNLPSLQTLALYYNQLSGSIPNFNLPNLYTIVLNNNNLSGSIPNFNLPNLSIMAIFNNQLSGSIPNFNLPNLSLMYIYNNKLTGTIPDFNLPNLTEMTLYDNQLSGTMPNFNLPKLNVLNINHNQLSGNLPILDKLPNLKGVILDDNLFSGSIPNFNLPNLQYININDNKLSGCIPPFFKTLCPWRAEFKGNTGLTEPNFTSFCTSNSGACDNTNSSDIALSIITTPAAYRPYTSMTVRVTAKNTGTSVLSNIKINLKRPDKMVFGGTKTPSVGTFTDYCAGGVECAEWTIPSLGLGATATLEAPYFVLDAVGAIVVTTNLLSSTPTDGNVTNNTASITLNLAPATSGRIEVKANQQIPVVIQQISPNPTDGDIVIELESLDTREVQFDFSNSIGEVVVSHKRAVEKGRNRLQFDVLSLPQGIYFVAPNTHQGHGVPTKFVKL